MARFGFLDECEEGDAAPAALPSFAPPESGLPNQLPQPYHGGGRDWRGFLDRDTHRSLRDAAASGEALNAVAPVSSSRATNGAAGSRSLLPLLILGGVIFAASR